MIKREIDAREWFVFCESPAAAQSRYVQDEHAYIINSGKDKVRKIDMTADLDSILDKVRKICMDIEVFISYVHCDKNLIQPLIDTLINKDYSVWTPENNLKPGDLWEKKISEAIIRCTYKGFYIVVITQESIKSSFVEKELAFASSQGAWIVPIVIGSPELPINIQRWIGSYKRISVRPTKEEFTWGVDILDDVVKKKVADVSSAVNPIN